MSPIYGIVTAAIYSIYKKCPQCGKKQILPRSKKGQVVNCKYCNAVMKPEIKSVYEKPSKT